MGMDRAGPFEGVGNEKVPNRVLVNKNAITQIVSFFIIFLK